MDCVSQLAMPKRLAVTLDCPLEDKMCNSQIKIDSLNLCISVFFF